MTDLYAMENEWRAKGFNTVCGVDEAGRGPLAGPVFAAAVVLPQGLVLPGLDDSKKLTAKRREALFSEITAKAAAYRVASASVAEIAELNILNASQLAMRRAAEGLGIEPDVILVDGSVARGFSCPTHCVVGGDRLCAAIAAASVLAKVSRDAYMLELAEQYPQYGFERHMGYGTALHRRKLLEHGPCPEHRALFLRKIFGGPA